MAASKVSSILLAMVVQGNLSSAFVSPKADHIKKCTHQHRLREIPRVIVRNAADGDSNNKEAENSSEGEGLGFTALPPIGASSFWDRPQDEKGTSHANSFESSDLAQPGSKAASNNIVINNDRANLVSAKFQIQYTCKVCDTRNSHSVTRLAYRKGVVIAQCKGCMSKHWLADNLGWSNHVGGFDFDNGETNIEMYMQNKDREARESGMSIDDMENDLVMRVNQDVFDLETMLHKEKQEKVASGTEVDEDDQMSNGNEMSWN